MNLTPEDTRNVADEFKGLPIDEIVEALDARGVDLEIAVENTLRDFNMGSIIRTANAFGVRKVHVVGRRQWNKRGAMMTDKYLHIDYHGSLDDFARYARRNNRVIVAIDNVDSSVALSEFAERPSAVMLFGQEGPGLSDAALATADYTVHIEQIGSTRSLNVGVAAGVAMYQWLHRYLRP